jgi:hypothetical protein
MEESNKNMDIDKLAIQCSKRIQKKLGWVNLLGSTKEVLAKILPIILEELEKKD